LKSNFRSRYRKQVLKNVLISATITGLLEFFLVMNLTMVGEIIAFRSRYNGMAYQLEYQTILGEILLVAIGVVVFAVSFLLLENRTIHFITDIYEGVKKLADGDLDTHIEVIGDDEFSEMALEINHLGEEIKKLIEKEREAEKTKHELITNVAHDLRTPLTSIIGYLELLENKEALSEEERKKFTDIVLNKSKRLESLIEDLFSLTKLNYGKITMNVEKIDLVKLLTQLLEEAYPAFMENDLAYELRVNENKIEINGDGNLLARLFDNIITNAIKYGKEGKRVEVVITGEEKNVTVKILNYGKMIPKKEIPYIFDKFYRVEQSRSEETGGTGLGLAIARDIAELHGGTIQVDSSLNGTVFIVRLIRNYDIHKENFVRTC